MYNLIEYIANYSETTWILWFSSKDKAPNFDVAIANTDNFKSAKYKTKLLGNKAAQPAPNNANGILENVTIAMPLKYLSNFRRSLKMPLINCKVELKLKWEKYCVLSAADNDNKNVHLITLFYYKSHKIICSCSNFISKRQSKTIKTS